MGRTSGAQRPTDGVPNKAIFPGSPAGPRRPPSPQPPASGQGPALREHPGRADLSESSGMPGVSPAQGRTHHQVQHSPWQLCPGLQGWPPLEALRSTKGTLPPRRQLRLREEPRSSPCRHVAWVLGWGQGRIWAGQLEEHRVAQSCPTPGPGAVLMRARTAGPRAEALLGLRGPWVPIQASGLRQEIASAGAGPRASAVQV